MTEGLHTLLERLHSLARSAVSDSDRAVQADVYVCQFCGHLLAYVTSGQWIDWRNEPTGGIWACPSCLLAECSFCRREATTHFWGYARGSSSSGGSCAPATWYEDLALCSGHTGGYKRRVYDAPLRQHEPIREWLNRACWTSPLYLRKHVDFLRELASL